MDEMARIRSGDCLPLACLILAAVVAASVPAAAQSLYTIKETSEGQAYLGSDFFVARPLPDASQDTRDTALKVTPNAVSSVATGVMLPLRTKHCALADFRGLREAEPSGFSTSFKRGGRGYYVCDPTFAPAFVLFSVEVDRANAKSFPDTETLARRIATTGMLQMPIRSPDAKCEASTSEDRLRLSCRRDDEVDGKPVEERGEVFVRGGDSFVSFNIACLQDQCAAAAKGLDDLVAAIDISSLRADATFR
uniref:hypothetical protein n=1 Tax=uncultured Caulobacter sp. TaxID=158749 RepID=UPI0025E73F61|nr:hypothetical protein [uncultured Caulobacter sp.]